MTRNVKPLVAGNWKMNGTRAALGELAKMCSTYSPDMQQRLDLLICPPATLLQAAATTCEESGMNVGGQDCHTAVSGAHTGDISAEMLADAGASAVIVGHSERRTDHGETNETVKTKTQAAISVGLVAIVCIGETKEEREAGKTLDVLKAQLAGSLPDESTAATVVIAYEPVWAIGTGLVPSGKDVEEAHAFMRDYLTSRFGDDGANMRLLYGGSVKPSNAEELMGIANVDGALVGGASLKAEDFLGICAAYEKLG